MPDWDHLKVVLAISRSGSLTGAAQQLGMDQTTVGRRLSALEKELGARIFVRAKSGFSATEEGNIVVTRARHVEAEIDRMQDALSGIRATTGGLVRLAGNNWMLERLAGQVLPSLLRENTELEMRLSARPPPAQIFSEPSVSLWFDAKPQLPEKAYPLCTVPYAAYSSRKATPTDGDWVQFRDDIADGPSFTRQVSRRLPNGAKVRLTATDASTLKSALHANIGQGTLPVCLGESDVLLRPVNLPSGKLERVLHLHVDEESLRLPRVRVLIETLVDNAADVFGGRILAKKADFGL